MKKALSLLLVVIILPACANVSRFERGALVAHGEFLDGSHEPLYYSVRVNLMKPVDVRIMNSRLMFSTNSPAFALNELKPELVSRYLPAFTPPPQWPDSWKEKAKKLNSYSGDGFHMDFKEGKLVFIGICSHCAGKRENPVVGTPDGKRFYKLPLNEQQLSDVFGPPRRVYKVNEVRY